jgi:hypothetical protein
MAHITILKYVEHHLFKYCNNCYLSDCNATVYNPFMCFLTYFSLKMTLYARNVF